MTEETVGTIACIGAGAMATALMKGWLKAGLANPQDITAVDILSERCRQVEVELGVCTSSSISPAVRDAGLVLVAVKPQHIPDVLPEISGSLQSGSLVISIAAGIPLALLEKGLGPEAAVVRVMPNTPCLVGHSATGISPGSQVTPAQSALVLRLFQAVGEAYVLPERLLDAVTGLSGSGPAYVYLFIEALSDGGVAAGLPREVALSLATQTVLGAAKMVMDTGQHPAVLREQVTSPAGTTAAGLLQLEQDATRFSVAQAVLKAAERSRELGKATLQLRGGDTPD